MVKVDLITGFLGSGKTTFIKKYALIMGIFYIVRFVLTFLGLYI